MTSDKSAISTKAIETKSGATSSIWSNSTLRLLVILLSLLIIVILGPNLSERNVSSGLETFVTIFLGIFIEAVPFLLAGSIVSGFIHVFVNQDTLYRFVPRHPLGAALSGGALGLIFPVCECGVVPVTRRLYQKGLPLSMGITFLLAAPVVNPVVMASTYTAFGWNTMLWARLGLSFIIAAAIGSLFYFAKPETVLLPQQTDHHTHHPAHHSETTQQSTTQERIWESLHVSGDDFLDMARYLIAGSMIAAAMQTLVPQATLLALGSEAVTSVLALMALAFVLSVCSTVDAFLALAFVSTFTPASILAFLVFGPMVDIKSALMFLGVFQRRIVLYLILLPLTTTLLVALYINLNIRWSL